MHDVLLQDAQCLAKFRNCRWSDYFLRLDVFDKNIALEFTHTFSEGKATVKGLEVVVTEERIIEVTRLPIDGKITLPPETPDQLGPNLHSRMILH